MRTTSRLAAVFVLMAMLPAPAAGAGTSPIQPTNRPTPIPGATNGELPSSDLINVAPNCEAARAAGPSLSLLLAEARQAGVVLGTEQCYRPLAGQIAAQQHATAAGNSACAATVATTPSGQPAGTSMHGWGKAADFFDAGGTVGFGSSGDRFLRANAPRLGWNHPGWAEPGGSACPEAWHWEWVGDGGTMGADRIRAEVVGLLPSSDDQGYATVTGLGALGPSGNFVDHGSAASVALAWVIVAAAPTPDGGGYWMVAADGGIFSFGDARFFGSTGAMRLNQPIVGMAPTPDGGGFWMVAADGGIFSFGDARFFGSTGAMRLNQPIVGMAPTPDGVGYSLVASDGGVFTFGSAHFAGSAGAQAPAEPVVAVVSKRSGVGYWLVAADGTVLAY